MPVQRKNLPKRHFASVAPAPSTGAEENKRHLCPVHLFRAVPGTETKVDQESIKKLSVEAVEPRLTMTNEKSGDTGDVFVKTPESTQSKPKKTLSRKLRNLFRKSSKVSPL